MVWEKQMYGIDKVRKKIELYLIFLAGFGLGPITDVSRTSPSRGIK